MSPDSLRARRIGTRLIAAAATGAVVAAAFAAPAAAEIPGISGDPAVSFSLSSTVTAGESIPGSITIDYSPTAGSENATHIVGAEFTVTGSADVVELTAGTDDPDAPVSSASCDASVAYTVTCTDSDTDANTVFGFDLGAVASAASETFGYTLKVTIDGTEVATRTGTVGVEQTYDVYSPYAHGEVVKGGVVPGTSNTYVPFRPTLYQDFDLAPTTAAAVVTFNNPTPQEGIDTSGLIRALDQFGNCRTTYDENVDATGMYCVITDLPDAKGQFLTFTKDINYWLEPRVAGPLDVCACTYSVETMDAATLAERYGSLSWITTSNPLGLTTTETGWDGAADSIAYFSGNITLTTADNSYDLEVDDTVLRGVVGDNVTVTTRVDNIGWASADDLNADGDGYLLRGQLPGGTKLVEVVSDGDPWDCYSSSELASVYAATPDTLLDHFDFACTVEDVWVTDVHDLTFTVKLTDTSAVQGAIEIGAVYNDGEYEGDTSNDFALLTTDTTESRYDYNQDYYEDLLVIRKSDGALRLYRGNSSGTYSGATTVSTGWGGYDIVMAGDLTNDGLPDLIARNNKTGTLYTYPGKGDGTFGSRISLGTGWNKMGQIAVGDFDGDGEPDIRATAFADGKMYHYQGLGNGKFDTRIEWGVNWNGMDVITSVGDLDGDGRDDFLTRWNVNGYYYLYQSADGIFELDQTLYDQDYTRRYDQVVGVGDLNRDRAPDIVSTVLATGELVRRHLDPENPWGGEVVIGTGWNALRLPVVELDRTYDVDYDGYGDVIAQRKSDGDVRLYWGTGSGLVSPWNMCDNCDGITWASAGGDYNSDGRTDMLIRTYEGVLYVWPGMDQGEQLGFDNAIKAGTGWNGYGYITGGFDYNSDGKDDMIARQNSTGYLYLYPGRGDGTFGSRVKIGSGWNAMRDISAVGDLDHDGRMDVLAMRSSTGCLYFYGGNGNGTIKNGVAVSCSWGGYDQITGVGDFDHDGHADWLARRKSDGALFLYSGNGAGGTLARKQIGTGWSSMSYIA
jgi:hypothetical protein